MSLNLHFRDCGQVTAARENRCQVPEIALELRMRLHAVLQAFHIRFQFCAASSGQRIDHPIPLPLGLHHSSAPQVGEMFRNFYLRLVQNFLKMTNAERPPREQMQNAEPRLIAQTLVNLNQFHK